jgi:hypothetical protein
MITSNPNMANINTNIPKETNILTKIEREKVKKEYLESEIMCKR